MVLGKAARFFQKGIRGGRIIDIGCGNGRDSAFFVHNGFDYVGIDASKNMLRLAEDRKVGGMKFMLMDFYHLQFPSKTFDGFWAAASLLHIPKRRIGKVLGAIRRILKPGAGGFIAMAIKGKVKAREGIVKENKAGVSIERYWAFYTKKEFSEYLKRSGFRIVKTWNVFQKEHDRIVTTKWQCFFVKKV